MNLIIAQFVSLVFNILHVRARVRDTYKIQYRGKITTFF